jgi:uncharacterized protein (TIGR00369 family)
MQTICPTADRLILDAEALNRFLAGALPHFGDDGRRRVVEASPGHVRMVMRAGERDLRPGARVSGATLMALADVAAYALVLAHIGPVEMAVTNSLTIHFLRACPMGPVTADARLLRLGRRIVTMEVRLWAASVDQAVAHATIAYTQP